MTYEGEERRQGPRTRRLDNRRAKLQDPEQTLSRRQSFDRRRVRGRRKEDQEEKGDDAQSNGRLEAKEALTARRLSYHRLLGKKGKFHELSLADKVALMGEIGLYSNQEASDKRFARAMALIHQLDETAPPAAVKAELAKILAHKMNVSSWHKYRPKL